MGLNFRSHNDFSSYEKPFSIDSLITSISNQFQIISNNFFNILNTHYHLQKQQKAKVSRQSLVVPQKETSLNKDWFPLTDVKNCLSYIFIPFLFSTSGLSNKYEFRADLGGWVFLRWVLAIFAGNSQKYSLINSGCPALFQGKKVGQQDSPKKKGIK